VAPQESFNYDVLVAPNLYGDNYFGFVRADGRGLGLVAPETSAKSLLFLNPLTALHPKYAGQNKVNPIATVLAAKMMLDWLGEKDMAVKIETATAKPSSRARSVPMIWVERTPAAKWQKQ